jgi:DNA-binding CsgD family transcriptional regulator
MPPATVDGKARRRLSLLVAHFRRSALIRHSIERHRADKAALVDALAQMAAAVFLVDSTGCISFTNDKGEALLSQANILRRIQSVLAAVDPKANRMLKDALAAAGRGDKVLSTRGVVIPLTKSQDERWLAHIISLAPVSRRQQLRVAAVAAVLVRKAELNIAAPLETLMNIYKLTAMEVRVLQAVVKIGGTPAVAEALGISETTVKTHLKGLFDKTGARRQADLVKLVAAHASPFAG